MSTIKTPKELFPLVIALGTALGIGLGLTAGLAYLTFQAIVFGLPFVLKSLFSLL